MLILICALLTIVLTCCSQPVSAAEKTFVLQEHLNKQWTQELLTYPFAAARGECLPESLSLTGPNGPVPVQLCEVEYWPNTQSVKSGKVSFVVDKLPPLATQTYTLSYGTVPSEHAVKSDLGMVITSNGGGQQATRGLMTSRFGVNLLEGKQTYEQPVASNTVPGPVEQLRLTDGTWFGGSALYGPTPVKSWSSRVTDDGPAFARVETIYTYADGSTLTIRTKLAAGDYALQFEMDVNGNLPDDGWTLSLNKGVAINNGVRVSGSRYLINELPLKFDPKSTAPACYLNAWPGDGWFPDSPSIVRLKMNGRPDELHLSIRDTGAWVTPTEDFAWKNFTTWKIGAPDIAWRGWMSKRIPLATDGDGVSLRMSLLAGKRKWTLGESADAKNLLDSFAFKATGAYTPLPRLNEVKEMVLDWPDNPNMKHPYVFTSPQEAQKSAIAKYEIYQDSTDPAKLAALLDNLGGLDYMRAPLDVAVRYDMVIDSGKLSPEERKLRKAQMAFFAYLLADPFHWSYERGMNSGNPNMTVSRYCGIGFAGCALREHPMGRQWVDYMTNWMQYWLNEVTDETGSWPESSHYARVSWSDFVVFALVARNGKYHDFFVDPKFKQMALFYEKTLTPPHPLRFNVGGMHPRATACYGRGNRNDAWGISGLLAAATAKTDPEFSRLMEWCWRESAYNENFSHQTGGMNQMIVNRELAGERPHWTSEFFPNLGYLLRSNVGDPLENYLLFVTRYMRSGDGEIWPADTGSITNWFAYGVPIGGNFQRIPETAHPANTCRVALATNWDPAGGLPEQKTGYVTQTSLDGAALLPQVEYVNVGFAIPEVNEHHKYMPIDMPAYPKREKIGNPPFQWQRQILQVTDVQADGPQYLILRDTVTGGQPTQWQFWTYSKKIGTPEEAANRQDIVLNSPGNKLAPVRELVGNRFTAVGQFGVDLEYYIANPTNTSRYTLRFGVNAGAYGVGSSPDFQDLLYLQMPGDGAYFVAMFPHRAGTSAPRFTTLGNGTVIKVDGDFGVDYAFLSKTAADAKAGDAAFRGTNGLVQDRTNGLKLTLGAAGTVSYRQFTLTANQPVALQAAPYALHFTTTPDAPSATITFRAPGKWVATQPGVILQEKAGQYTLTLPAGLRDARLAIAEK